MKLIVGLGNPGQQYKNTRHNAGFMFLNYLIGQNNFGQFKYESKFKGDILTKTINGEKVIFLKPQTFMNLSGESVRKIINFYKIDIGDIIIIYDDISMDFGKIRFRQKGSHGGQNGIRNILKHTGQDIYRIKIGVGLDKRYNISNWVLSKFDEDELIDINTNIFPEVEELLFEKFLQ